MEQERWKALGGWKAWGVPLTTLVMAASFVNTFAPQKVVIGGGISEAGQFYIDMIKKSTFSYAMPDCSVFTDVIGATLGNNAGCMGAASLVFKNTN